MADDGVVVREINWREAFGFTHLFRAFRVAVHPSKLILALVALGCLWCGGLVLDAVWNHHHQVTFAERDLLWASESPYRILREAANAGSRARHQEVNDERQAGEIFGGIFQTFFEYEVLQANNVLTFGQAGLPGWHPFESVWRFVAVGPKWLWSYHWLFALIYTIWFLLIWSVFGGAISRIAAVHVAREEKISVRHALTFSVNKVLSFIFAPVIPVFIVLGIGVVIAIASTLLFHIPWIGPILAGLFFFLTLIGGFVITLVILG